MPPGPTVSATGTRRVLISIQGTHDRDTGMEHDYLSRDSDDARRATFFLIVGFCTGLGLGIATLMAGGGASDPAASKGPDAGR